MSRDFTDFFLKRKTKKKKKREKIIREKEKQKNKSRKRKWGMLCQTPPSKKKYTPNTLRKKEFIRPFSKTRGAGTPGTCSFNWGRVGTLTPHFRYLDFFLCLTFSLILCFSFFSFPLFSFSKNIE